MFLNFEKNFFLEIFNFFQFPKRRSLSEVENPIYEVFIVRSILSLKSLTQSQVHFCLSRLVLIATECRATLEPTHLCNAIRGLCESLGINRKQVEDDFYLTLEPLFEALAEHPLDVVRVNIWKMYKMTIESKLLNFEENKTTLQDEINLIKNQKIQKRFNMVKLSALCADSRTYKMLCSEYDDLIANVIRSRNGTTKFLLGPFFNGSRSLAIFTRKA